MLARHQGEIAARIGVDESRCTLAGRRGPIAAVSAERTGSGEIQDVRTSVLQAKLHALDCSGVRGKTCQKGAANIADLKFERRGRFEIDEQWLCTLIRGSHYQLGGAFG